MLFLVEFEELVFDCLICCCSTLITEEHPDCCDDKVVELETEIPDVCKFAIVALELASVLQVEYQGFVRMRGLCLGDGAAN